MQTNTNGRQRDNTRAVAARIRYSAERALDHPVKVRRAVAIVRAGLDHGRLSPDDVLPEAGGAGDDRAA